MPRLLTVHVGGVDLGRERLFESVKSTRPEIIYELNNWLFDYFYAHKAAVQQLPPLDDWIHSGEDSSYWSIAFPDPEWNIWVRSELLEFKV